MKKHFTSIVLSILFSQFIYSQNYNWAESISGSGNSKRINQLVSDLSGNIYVAGRFDGSADFDPGVGTNIFTNSNGNSSTDIFFAKYDSLGSMVWVNHLKNSVDQYTFEQATDIYVDNSGYIYLAGRFSDSVDFEPGSGIFKLGNKLDMVAGTGNLNNVFFAKYDNNGNLIWAKNIGKSYYSDQKFNIAVDNNSNIYVAGEFCNTPDFDPGVGIANLSAVGFNGNANVFFAKYDSNGSLIWVKQLTPNTNTDAVHLAELKTDQSNNVLLTGQFSGIVDFDPNAGTSYLNSTNSTYFAKYNDNGDFIFAKYFNGGSSFSEDLMTDNYNNIFLTGQFEGNTDFDASNSTDYFLNSITSPGKDIYIAKYDSAGNFLWTKQINANIDQVTYNIQNRVNICKANNNNICISGTFYNTSDFDPSPGTVSLTASSTGSQYDAALFFAEYDSSGNFKWAKHLGQNNYGARAYSGVTISNSGRITIGGSFSRTIDFNPATQVNNLVPINFDMFLAQYQEPATLTSIAEKTYQFQSIFYPNPVKNILFIQSTEKIKSIKCTNYVGQDVELKLLANSIDISMLSDGIYFLTIINVKGIVETKKFVKQ